MSISTTSLQSFLRILIAIALSGSLFSALPTSAQVSLVNAGPISKTPDGHFLTNGSGPGELTPDGRYVLISANDREMVGGNTTDPGAGYLVDRQTGTVQELVHSLDGQPVNSYVQTLSITPEARYILLATAATNVYPGADGQNSQFYVLDRQTGNLQLATADAQGNPSNGYNECGTRSNQISDNGRFVVFCSTATNLVPNDTNSKSDVFLKDMQTQQITKVSTAPDGSGANDNSGSVAINGSGRYIAFESLATNITSDSPNNAANAYLFDAQTATSRLISITPSGGRAEGNCADVAISGDGSKVVFSCTGASGFTTNQDTINTPNVFMWTSNGSITPISVLATGEPIGLNPQAYDYVNNYRARISYDGRLVNFESDSSGQTIWVHDNTDGTNTAMPQNSTPTGSISQDSFVQGPTSNGDYIVVWQGYDQNFHDQTWLAEVKPDTIPPTINDLTWSSNPVQVGTNTTLTMSATDNLGPVATGEYFIGPDPGAGFGNPMTPSNGNFVANIALATPGVYSIGVRAKDPAGNWSATSTTMLVVYDANTSLGMTGKNSKDLVPNLNNGDIMPGLVDSSQTDTADYGFTVQYKNGVLDSHNGFKLNYSTGTNCNKASAQNCHSFALNATNFDWLVLGGDSNSQGWFQGTATLTIDGITSSNPFSVTAIDGGLLNPSQNDSLVFKVFAPGANPQTATPLYRISGSMSSGNSVKIQ